MLQYIIIELCYPPFGINLTHIFARSDVLCTARTRTRKCPINQDYVMTLAAYVIGIPSASQLTMQ